MGFFSFLVDVKFYVGNYILNIIDFFILEISMKLVLFVVKDDVFVVYYFNIIKVIFYVFYIGDKFIF